MKQLKRPFLSKHAERYCRSIMCMFVRSIHRGHAWSERGTTSASSKPAPTRTRSRGQCTWEEDGRRFQLTHAHTSVPIIASPRKYFPQSKYCTRERITGMLLTKGSQAWPARAASVQNTQEQ